MRLTKTMTLHEWLGRFIQVMAKVRDGEEMTKADWQLPELLTDEAESPTTRT